MLHQKQTLEAELPEQSALSSVGTLERPANHQLEPFPSIAPQRHRAVALEPLPAAALSSQKEVLGRLQSAHLLAVRTQRNVWDFAIAISEFHTIDTSELRALIYQGFVEHRAETTPPGSLRRTFQAKSDVVLSQRSCLAITPKGVRALVGWTSSHQRPEDGWTTVQQASSQRIPLWDADRRELRLGDEVVKYFRWPAENQEAVLNAFEAQGWPSQIADPLPEDPNICSKRRLHDTIKCLNRRRITTGIKFHGDGTGRGVVLKLSSREM